MVNDVLKIMQEIAQNDAMTLMIVTHEMGFAKQVADRVIFMADGKILEDSPTQEFFENPKEPRAKQFLSQIMH
jgi:putative glutamine transport system ATP-binding protein